MKKESSAVAPILSLVLSALLFSGCAAVAEQISAMANLTRCQFRLASVEKTALAGIPLQGTKVSDINLLDLARLKSSFSAGSLPLRFTVNMEVKNPNTSKAGLHRMEWTALLDGETMTSGVLEKSVEIAPDNGVGNLPLEVALDLKKTFSGRTLDSLLNLAMNVAGEGTKPTRLTFQVKPSMTVAGQTLVYPGFVTVNHEFSSSK